jgi:hypothetical protein
MTRAKDAGIRNVSTLTICRRILAAEGLGGLYKGVNAVALRQMTTWASRIGITRLNESVIRRTLGKSENSPLSVPQKIFSSCVGGAISCWNQPFEVSTDEPPVADQSGPENRNAVCRQRLGKASGRKAVYAGNGDSNLPAGRNKGILPRDHTSHRSRDERHDVLGSRRRFL